MNQYDIVIIGAGLGGLLSAVFLAKQGKKVAVIEQNKQIGGCLQTFAFEKKVFDSCVHYIGSMDEGQAQHRIFQFAGIHNDLKLKKLGENAFDEICYGEQEASYPLAQGAENFINQLGAQFPKEINALKEYVRILQKTTDHFPLFHLRSAGKNPDPFVLKQELSATIAQIFPSSLLQNVVTGNNLLYAGRRGRTPFYVHALVTQSYMNSAYTFIGGSSQISKLLRRRLQELGAEVFTKEKVQQLILKNGQVDRAVSESGRLFRANTFIANVHPQQVLKWIEEPAFTPAFKKRVHIARNTASAFMVNIVLKPKRIPHPNKNIYWHKNEDSFASIEQLGKEWPSSYALYFGEDQKARGFSDTLAILTYEDYHSFEKWHDTLNHSVNASIRDEDYHQFKEEKANLLMEVVAQRFPDLIQNILSFQVATPLTFKDYMGTSDGSMYGIDQDLTDVAQTKLSPLTKIPNLFLTGQNVGLHGVLGVSISALKTSSLILGNDSLIHQIAQST